MPRLAELTLAGTPVSRKQAYRALLLARSTSLQTADGTPVTAEERDYVNGLALPAPAQVRAHVGPGTACAHHAHVLPMLLHAPVTRKQANYALLLARR